MSTVLRDFSGQFGYTDLEFRTNFSDGPNCIFSIMPDHTGRAEPTAS